jgi:hypothetical protein
MQLEVPSLAFHLLVGSKHGGLGPDTQGCVHTRIESGLEAPVTDPSPAPAICVDFFASELRMRGDAPVQQPHEAEGDIFCWNGEVSTMSLSHEPYVPMTVAVLSGIDFRGARSEARLLFFSTPALMSPQDVTG